MNEIYVLTGTDLALLVRLMDTQPGDHPIYKVSVCMDDGLKVKVNEDCWTAPLGSLL